MPPEVQSAIDAGDADRVTALLTPLPDGMSKSQQKKLVKQAQIAGKRLAQGKPAHAASLPSAGAKPKAEAKGDGGAHADVIKPAAGTVAGVEEQAIIADLLAAIGGLVLPDGAASALQGQRAALCSAIAPRVNAIRNDAYAQGFTARAYRVHTHTPHSPS